ncbi:MAG TPA: hypothetical protein VI819_04430 [Patescibacteria group bacterium]|nr:hypothetical protein [Patescibacteria group bacterium]
MRKFFSDSIHRKYNIALQIKLTEFFKHPNKIILGFIFFYLFLILTYRLDKNPPGFFIDESIYGYEAYSIITTKGFSSNHEFLPFTFQNPGETMRNHSIYTYLLIPFVTIFGLNEFSVRLASVCISLLIVILLYKLLKKRVLLNSIFLGILIWPSTSWAFLVSRFAMDTILVCFIFLLSVFYINRIFSDPKEPSNLKCFVFSLILSFLYWAYVPGRLFALAFLIYFLFYSLIKYRSLKTLLPKYFLIFSVLAIFTLLPSIKLFIEGSFLYRADELTQCKSITYCFIKNIASHFSIRNYFVNNYLPPDFPVYRHSIWGTSLLPRYTIPFIILGILSILKGVVTNKGKNRAFYFLLIFSFVVGIIPASLTIRGFDSIRSVVLLPIIFIIIIYGINSILKHAVNSTIAIRMLIPVMILVYIACFSFKEIKISFAYEYNTNAAGYSGWQYGFRQIYNYFVSEPGKYSHLGVTPYIAYLPDLYIRFFKYPPTTKTIFVNSSQTFIFGDNTLFAVTPGETYPVNFEVKKIIYYPNRMDIAYYLVAKKDIPTSEY